MDILKKLLQRSVIPVIVKVKPISENIYNTVVYNKLS